MTAKMLITPVATFYVYVPRPNHYLIEEYYYKFSKTMPLKRTFVPTPICWENSFVKSRPHMAPQSEPQSGNSSYIDLLSIRCSSEMLKTRLFHLMEVPICDLFFERVFLKSLI